MIMTNRIFLLIVALLFLSCKKSEEFSEDFKIQAVKLPAKVDQVKFRHLIAQYLTPCCVAANAMVYKILV